jgi:hypothetical protein
MDRPLHHMGKGAEDHAELVALMGRMVAPFLACEGGNLAAGMVVDLPQTSMARRATAPLEGLCRVLAGIAPALEAGLLDARPWHQMLAMAFDPGSSGYMIRFEIRQPVVELAFLAQAALRAPNRLWAALPEGTKAHVVDAWKRSRAVPAFQQNWVLFPAIIEAGLILAGEAPDFAPVEHAFSCFDEWYKGDGAYGDGPQWHWDYYNSYVIHPMLIDLIEGVTEARPALAGRIFNVLVRARRYAEVLERLIGPDGTYPPLGRSICYRGGAFHLLAQLALKDLLPASLPPAQVRSALMAVARRTLQSEANWRPDGWLTIGVSGAQASMGEEYINTGSLYLASLVFLPLGLPLTDPFWTAPPLPFTQKKLWTQGESIRRDRSLHEGSPGHKVPDNPLDLLFR